MPFGATEIPPLNLSVAGLVLASAAASALGNLLLVLAYARAPATRLAPFIYFQLIAATAYGWLFFGDLPDPVTFAGLFLLVARGRIPGAPAVRASTGGHHIKILIFNDNTNKDHAPLQPAG